jgi:eukaryotic-like serine/threonine-protein kinase
VLQACEALACAHAAGIVHRDIKPENLFLTQQAASVECVKVLDFGISKSAMAGFEPAGRKFAATMLPMGTPGYMSPEQIRACGTVDARTDIWALGCVLSELMTGTNAFTAPTLLQLGAVILEREPIPLRKALPEAPPELEALIAKCLEKDPDRRFQDVAELAAALYRFGPRRSRISAERCHQVLKGRTGVVIEFNSVPPPSLGGGSTPLPVSSMGPTVSPVPVAAPGLGSLRAGTRAPGSLFEAPFAAKKRGKTLLVAVALAGSALGGVVLALGVGAHGAAKSAALAPAAAPSLPAPAATARVSASDAAPAKARTAPATEPISLDDPLPAGEAPTALASARPHGKPARAQRAAAAQAARQDAAAASAKPKAQSAKRGLDDSEPDVGY